MSESEQHRQLVAMIIQYIKTRIKTEYTCLIETDLSDNRPIPGVTKEGFRPDVFFEYEGLLLIGEAKTYGDVLREHSLKQYKSYIRKCSLYKGKAEYIMAVPWLEQASVKNKLNIIRKDFPGDYDIIVIGGIV